MQDNLAENFRLRFVGVALWNFPSHLLGPHVNENKKNIPPPNFFFKNSKTAWAYGPGEANNQNLNCA